MTASVVNQVPMTHKPLIEIADSIVSGGEIYELDGFDVLIRTLPTWAGQFLKRYPDIEEMKFPVDRFATIRRSGDARPFVTNQTSTREDLQRISSRLNKIGEDNRAGIEGTLHRFSVLRTHGIPTQWTMRLARVIGGVAEPLRAYLGGSVLLAGPGGVGKTTTLRDMIRIGIELYTSEVGIVDTSGEIGGYGERPHPVIGTATWSRVIKLEEQNDYITDLYANHSTKLLAVDEMKNPKDGLALEQGMATGMKVWASIHGRSLRRVLGNVNAFHAVGAIDWDKRIMTKEPVFDTLILVVGYGKYMVYENLSQQIQSILDGGSEDGLGLKVGKWD